jgi:hypothetical protein
MKLLTRIVLMSLALSSGFAQANPQEGGPSEGYNCWAWKCGERGQGMFVSSGKTTDEASACLALNVKCSSVCCEYPPSCTRPYEGGIFTCNPPTAN